MCHMIYKARSETDLLKILRVLNSRTKKSIEQQQYYSNLEKGYEGEVLFDLLTEQLTNDCLILNDLLLEINDTRFQVDTLIIYQDLIYLIDIKYFEGDYLYDGENFKTTFKKIVKDPLNQLDRSKSLLLQLLQHLRFNMNVEAYVVFNHPDFTLYQAPQNKPIILPTQLNRFMKKLEKKPSNLTNSHKKLAEKLVSLNIAQMPDKYLPSYSYEEVLKGITCANCHSFSVFNGKRKVVCSSCGHEELLTKAVIRNVDEVKLLFPNRKITTKEIYDWCKVIESKKKITRILGTNFVSKGKCRWTSYE
jgi:hypothetical protein